MRFWLAIGCLLCAASAQAAKPAPAQTWRARQLYGLSVTVYWPPNQAKDRLCLTDKAADDLKDLGVAVIRMAFWSKGGTLDWNAYDEIVRRLAKRNIGVMGLLDNQLVGAPKEEWGSEAYLQRFLPMAERLVKRYGWWIKDWEVWNEEDFFDFAIPSQEYGRLLTRTYETIKRIQPGALVSTGGVSSAWESSAQYLSEVYASPACKDFHKRTGHWPFDVVSIHPYAWDKSPREYLETSIFDNFLLLMQAHGDANKPIWLTEIGWNTSATHPTRVGDNAERNIALQAQYLTELYDICKTATRKPYSPMKLVQRVYWYEYHGDFGLEDYGGKRRSSALAYQKAARGSSPSKETDMEKVDLRKQLKYLYNPSAKQPEIVEVPAMNYLMVDGKGDPNTSPAYQQSIQALYTMAYTLKFRIKSDMELDYPVMALEGLWWADDMTDFMTAKKDNWKWTSMIMQPDTVTPELFKQLRAEVEKKKPELAAIPKLRYERFHEGRCAQIMHIGPYSEEGPTIAKLHAFIAEQGSKPRGKHHEIYLGDPRRSAPEKLRTIIRQPME